MVETTPQASSNRLGGGLQAAVILICVIGAALLVNATFSQIHWRIDLTSEKIYTLSPATHQILADLEEPVEVRAFLSPNLPPPYHNLERQVEELLAEYRAASDGKLDYRIIVAADDDEEATESARGYGIDKTTIGQQTTTELSYRKVFKGVAFVQGDRAEVVGDLRVSGRPELDNFEYEFSRALLNLSNPEPRRVALVTGAGGPAHDGRVVNSVQNVFSEFLGGLLVVEPINIREEREIDEEYSAVIFWNISEDLGDEALEALDTFVAGGGNVGWFQSGGVIDQQSLGGATAPLRRPLESDLIDHMRRLGIHFGADAVIDRERAMAFGAVQTEQGLVQVHHPALFPITELAHELAPLRHYSALVIPLPATVHVDDGVLGSDVDVHRAMITPESSVRLASPPGRAVYEELVRPTHGEQAGPQVVAVALEGPVRGSESSRIFVIGSGEFMSSYPEIGYQGQLSGLGLEFFVNTVEWLAQQEELAQIRGKSRPPLIADVPAEARQSIQIINIVIVPVFFGCIAIFMFARRVRRRRELSVSAPMSDDLEAPR